MAIDITAALGSGKPDILAYLRARAREHSSDIVQKHGREEYKKNAASINKALARERDALMAVMAQKAEHEAWDTVDHLRAKLMLLHCANVVMLESRNSLWPYDYMTFSRRIGEIWEPLVRTCFEIPVSSEITLFVPPLFDDIRKRLAYEVRAFILQLPITDSDKNQLISYYEKVWTLVTSGDIKLVLDIHFKHNNLKHVVDCKSGFGSNEKGNTNRLLLVASIYHNIEPDDYKCILFVRSEEDENNHYLGTLQDSGLWDVYCGQGTYAKIRDFVGFDLASWIDENIDWQNDLGRDCYDHLCTNSLDKYLLW